MWGVNKLLTVDRPLLEKLFYRLVATPGITGTEMENRSTEAVIESFNEMQYFQQNPRYLQVFPVKGDIFNRKVVTALVKGSGSSNKTVVMIGHTDVVDVQNYGKNSELAFKPELLMKELDPDSLDQEAKKDFLSGEWVFGRGVMDMRCGVAAAMALIEAASHCSEELNGNLLFVAVPDEENNSVGMISATDNLIELAREYDLDYRACIDGEPFFPRHPGDDQKYVYEGTLGKFVLMAYCTGKGTHGGDPLAGLNANLIISELTRRIELNMDLADAFEGEVFYPPTNLKQADTKEVYDITTPESAYAYYNFLTANQSPAVFFNKVRHLAREALKTAFEKQRSAAKKYIEISGKEGLYQNWVPKVLSYSELVSEARKSRDQSFNTHMETCREKWRKQPELDQRILALEIVREVNSLCADQGPKIILFYVPSYYPHVKPFQDTEKGQRAAEVIREVCEYAKIEFNEKISVEKFFPGLCDLSFVSLQNAEDVTGEIAPNMPNWGFTFSLPVANMKKLGLPVMNIGPFGKDAHKNSERLHKDFSFRVYPALLAYAIDRLLSDS